MGKHPVGKARSRLAVGGILAVGHMPVVRDRLPVVGRPPAAGGTLHLGTAVHKLQARKKLVSKVVCE